jgi:hypothetical protein
MPLPVSLRSTPARTPRQRGRGGVITFVSLALAVVLAGCSQDDPARSGSDATPTKGASGGDANAGLKNGTALKAALMTAKDLPARYKVDPAVVRDSAEAFNPAAKVVAPTRASCKELQTNLWIQAAGVDSASFAQTGFTDGVGSEIDAEIESYRAADSQKVMKNLRKLFSVCSTFKLAVEGAGRATINVVTKPGPKVGDESIRAVVTSPVWQGGTTLIAVRSGKEIVSVLSSSAKNNGGPAAAKQARLMVGRLSGGA